MRQTPRDSPSGDVLALSPVAAIVRVLSAFLMLTLSTPSLAEDPKIAYWLHCAGCHGLEGRGTPPEIPTLIDQPGVIAALPGGREYLIRIPGVAQAGLDDAALTTVLNFMMETFSGDTLTPSWRPFREKEVRRYREQVLKDPLRTREEVLAGRGIGDQRMRGAGQ